MAANPRSGKTVWPSAVDTPVGADATDHRARTSAELEAALDALPGWGPVTVGGLARTVRNERPSCHRRDAVEELPDGAPWT